MPKRLERKIRKRGGAIRYRVKATRAGLLICAVTRKAGPRGGRTICWKRKRKRKR